VNPNTASVKLLVIAVQLGAIAVGIVAGVLFMSAVS
jgi:hypothetical protein